MTIGCLLLLLLVLGSLMVRVAPAWVETPIASVSLWQNNRTGLRIMGYDFTCTSQKAAGQTIDRCTTTIQNSSLAMTLTHAKPYRAFETQGIICQAAFSGKAVPCEVWFDFATGNRPNVVVKDSLGLSNVDLQALRQQHFLSQISDSTWNDIVLGIAIAASLLAALSAWLDPNTLTKMFAGVSLGCLAYGLAQTGLGGMVYRAGREIDLSRWLGIVSNLAIVLGIVVGGAAIRLLRSHSRVARIFTILGSAYGIFSLVGYVLLFSVLALGFVD
jgi:hypothetical protein